MHKIHFKNKHLKTPENILAMCVPANFDTAVGTVKQNVKKQNQLEIISTGRMASYSK